MPVRMHFCIVFEALSSEEKRDEGDLNNIDA